MMPLRAPATAALAAALAGCASFSTDGGTDRVTELTKERTGQAVLAQRSSEDAGSARVRVAELLRQPLSADGAVEIERGTWRYIDAQGKAWRYRKTPFGLVRFAEEDAMPDDEPITDIAAVDKGDTVEFQRRTPFGISKWTRKKSELDANEKLALERSRRPAAGASKAAQE